MALPDIQLHEVDVLERKKTLQGSSSSMLHGRITSFSLSNFCHQKAVKFKEMCSLYIIQCSFPIVCFVNSISKGFEMMRTWAGQFSLECIRIFSRTQDNTPVVWKNSEWLRNAITHFS